MGTTSEREAPVRFQDVPPDLQAAVGEILRPKGLTVAGTNGAKWVPAMVVWAREGEEAGARDVTRRFQEGFDMAQAVESLREELESGTMMQKLGKIEGSIEAVARGTYELRQENEELRKFQQLGFFQFAVRVDGEDFRRFAIIMALGTRNAAAAFLRIPQRSFYDRVERWAEMGPDYQRMLRFVDWRKRAANQGSFGRNGAIRGAVRGRRESGHAEGRGATDGGQRRGQPELP
jgi:hypothetical protein